MARLRPSPAVGAGVEVARLGFDFLGLPLRLRAVSRGGFEGVLRRAVSDQGRAFEIAVGDDSVTVQLDPGSNERLRRLASQAIFLPSMLRVVKVEVRVGVAGGVEVWPYRVPEGLIDTGRRFGTVPGSDASAFGRLIAVADRVGQPCICGAVIARGHDGVWKMAAMRPLEERTSSEGVA